MDIIEKAIRAGILAQRIKNDTAELEALFGAAKENVAARSVVTDQEDAPTGLLEFAAPASQSQPGETGVARKRGRPPGSPNKPKPTAITETATTTETSTTTPHVNDALPWGDDAETEAEPTTQATTESTTEDPGF